MNTANSDKVKKPRTDEDIIACAKERFKLAEDAEQDIRQQALDDLRFRSGDQWPEEIKRVRNQEHRPTLTVNRIPQFVRQITNDQRQNRPSIRVSPVDDNADVDTAKVIQGLIRQIEYSSNADEAYDTAFEGAVTKGFGYFRVVTDYVHPMSFDQEIRIEKIKNDFSVYIDPTFTKADGSDINWAFVFEDLTHEEFKQQYPKADIASLNEMRSTGEGLASWMGTDFVRVAEYFYKEFDDVEILLFRASDGSISTIRKDQADKVPGFFDKNEIIDKRMTEICKIKWCKITATEVLEQSEWAGQWIPIIPVFGDWLDVDGKKIYEGIVRHAKDPQRMLNYWVTSETEAIALAPRAPFIGAEGQFDGHEEKWATANNKSHAYLEYKPTTLDNGQVAPPPQRNNFEPAVAAITNARMQASDDLKATTGIFDASLGNKSNENSGIAIHRRTMQAQTSNFHFIDNLSRALKHTGRILLDLIPKVYDTERTIRIIGEEGDEEIIAINKLFENKGKQTEYDFSIGRYDVTVATGPSYASKRQEALDSMIALTQKYPDLMRIAGDLLIKNMDWPGAQEIADRFKRTMDPQIVGVDDGSEEIPVAAMMQLKQQGAMIEQLSQLLNEQSEILDKEKFKYEFETRKALLDAEMKRAKIEADMRQTLLKEDAMDSREAFKQEIQSLNNQNYLNQQQPSQPEVAMGPGEMQGYEGEF